MNVPENIKFSIITPVYNREDCIDRCIESVINQNYSNIEMWVIDDGSTDKTEQVIQNYLSEHSFIRFYKFDNNRGVNAARNYGIQNSTGDFIIFLDSDDWLVDDILHFASNLIKSHPQYKQFMLATDDRLSYYNQNSSLSNESAIISFPDFLTEKISGDFFHIISTDIIKKYPFPEDLRTYEALSFLQIFKETSNQLFYKKIAVKRERGRNDSVSTEYKLTDMDSIKKKYSANVLRLKVFEEDYRKYDNDGNIVEKTIKETYLLGLAISNYDLDFLESLIKEWNKKIPIIYRSIRLLRLGYAVRIAINMYSKLKNNIR